MKKAYLFTFSLLLGLFTQCMLFSEIVDINQLERQGNVDPNREYQTGPCVCYCQVTRFYPKYYNTTRCVKEPYTTCKKCCRYVPKYYGKVCCRYVPQYYTQQCCYYVPEYYYVNETKYCEREVCDQHCCYVPCNYTKRTCLDDRPNTCAQPATTCAQPANYQYYPSTTTTSTYQSYPQTSTAPNYPYYPQGSDCQTPLQVTGDCSSCCPQVSEDSACPAPQPLMPIMPPQPDTAPVYPAEC